MVLDAGIIINNLTLTYQRHPAVHHLNGFFPLGSLNCIMGPNGGGKSTLMKAIAGLHPIDEGCILRPPQLDFTRTAYLQQSHQWDRSFPITVYELAKQGLLNELSLWKPKLSLKQKNRVQSALELVGLWHLKNQALETLSLGQFQRALFARVIVQDAELILLDEPLTGLDEPSIKDFFKILHQWNKMGKTLIVVMHDRDLAQQHFNNTLILNKESLAWGPSSIVLEKNYWNQKMNIDFISSLSEIKSNEECIR